MKKSVTELLKDAETATNQKLVKNKEIKKEYKGYISSFGAAVIQSGLLPAIYFNYQSEGSAKDRKLLMDAIYEIIKKQVNATETNLLEYAKSHHTDKKAKELILDAATALKLVIRTYKLV